MSHQDYRRTSYETWEAMAPGWERRRAELEEALTPVRTWLITKLAPQPGDTVLELGAGPGDTGFAAAALVGEAGRLISSDFSPEMVEVARRRGADLGLENVDHRVIDAERIDLDVASVDGVLCRSAFMLVADPAGRLVGDTPRAAPWRALGVVCLGCAGAQPMGVHRRADPRRARSSPTAGTRCARSLQHGERRAHACVARRRGFHRRAHRRGTGALRLSAISTTTRGGYRTSVARSRWFSEACPRASSRHSGLSSEPRSSPMRRSKATSSAASP